MIRHEEVKRNLESKFPHLKDKVVIRREHRLFASVEYKHFREVFNYLVNDAGFSILCTITGLDEGERFDAIYHIAREDGIVMNLRTGVPWGDPVIATVTDRFSGADAYERELVDLFGITVCGLPPGPRYPLPDNWPAGEYPLRKNWKGNLSEVAPEEGGSADA
jgi:Ni,Fe-hydrogenase III component G